MDRAEKKLAFQVQFWGLIGPMIALVILFVILLKSPSQSVYLSITTIFGIFVSLKWKLKGALLSFAALLICYIYQYSEITPDEHLWHIGMSLSILTACAITALSLYEVEQLLHPEPENIFDEEISSLKQLLNEEKTKYVDISKELLAKLKAIESYESLVETVKNEMTKSNDSHEKVLNDLLQKQHQLSLVEEKLYYTLESNQKLTHQLRHVEDLENSLKLKTEELLVLKKNLEKNDENLQSQKSFEEVEAMQELKSTNELLSRERGRLETLLFRTQIDLHQKTQELIDLPKIKEELDLLKVEKQQILQDLQWEAESLKIQLNEEIAKKNLLEVELKETCKKEELNLLKEERMRLCVALDTEIAKTNDLENELKEAKKISVPANKKTVENEKFHLDLSKIEGKYKQLREQFQLKSDVLDATRKELFKTKEEVLRLQLDTEECEIYHLSEAEFALQKHLLKVITETDEKIHLLETEIQELQKIISSVF